MEEFSLGELEMLPGTALLLGFSGFSHVRRACFSRTQQASKRIRQRWSGVRVLDDASGQAPGSVVAHYYTGAKAAEKKERIR